MLPRNLHLLVHREEDGFVACCPELSISTGKEPTEERARAILRQGIALAFLADDYMEPKRKRK